MMINSFVAAALLLASAQAFAVPTIESEVLSCILVDGQKPQPTITFEHIGLFMEVSIGTPNRPGSLLFEATQGRILIPANITAATSSQSTVNFKDMNGNASTLAVSSVNRKDFTAILSHANSVDRWTYKCTAPLR